MRTPHRAVGILSGLAATCALALASASPAAAATWVLQDFPESPQRICLPPHSSWDNTYFLAPIQGTWDTRIDTGVRNLPPGSFSNGGAVHPSDWNENTNGYVGFVHVSIAPAPAGEYVAELWADDGTETQTAPVIISVREDCYG